MTTPLWRTKPVSSAADSQTGLKRVLGPWQLVALGVGVTIGAGLFSLTGVAAGQNAGPAVTLSFVIAAVACGFAGLCYGELASMIPSGGSAYSYAYASMGELIAWIIGWDLVLEYTVGAAAVASSWSGYLASLLGGWGLHIDPRLLATPMTPVTMPDGSMASAWFNLPAVCALWGVTALLMRGVSESTTINTIVVCIKLAVIVAVIAACAPHISFEHYHPFIPQNTGTFGQFGISGVMRAAGMAFFAYLGFDIVSTTAQDSRNPARDIPIGILGSLLVCSVVYAVFSMVLTGVVDYRAMANDPSPVATAIDVAGMPWLASLVKLGITAGYISVLFGLLMGQARVFLIMSHDGLLPPVFSKLNARTHTPWTSHLMFAALTSGLAAVLPIGQLGNMTSIGTLLAFIIVCIGVPVLRARYPDAPRQFRVPGGLLVPVLGILSCGAVMVSLDRLTWIRLVVWLAIGLAVYFAYGIRNSRLCRRES
ncbi:APC family permease [Gluconobacter roseus]|uniref:Amino acid transporter n=1 Tax=Gluconobacter roseus NBRC 3990 TaxID=1307950 RepID=A0A4Y3M2U5_9PROT|nr:amino acid permease [Gluconobacter roseus]KXV43327.1 amino acid transporter [Gluconobacter roseus]GBR42437.1 amino acid transporter [Gluconobacter roseus NBRC 3990]GEB03622.1 amino acid transporter [Gluconobacter roseus NBRC 3990]GLP94077.1 amino acid transporter [Gluconobacter roseus NBRC 3990]